MDYIKKTQEHILECENLFKQERVALQERKEAFFLQEIANFRGARIIERIRLQVSDNDK